MLIESPCVVALTWTLFDAQGQSLDELSEPVEFYFGGHDLLPKVESTLDGQDVGFEALIHLEPEEAFGEYNSALVCFENRQCFPEGITTGMQFDGLPVGCKTPAMPSDVIYTVTEIYPEHVVLDGNHPLAGLALRLQLRVHDVRAATDEELESRSVGEMALRVLDVAPPAPGLH